MKRLLIVTLLLCLVTPFANGKESQPDPPGKKDRCAVCGMFVAKYPQWIGVVKTDEGLRYFDGCKCMFRYLLDPDAYETAKHKVKPGAIHVTDYYSTRLIDGRKASYVIGSDVLGPMGHELIPFETEKDAREFMTDHKGKQVIGFAGVTKDVIKSLMHKR